MKSKLAVELYNYVVLAADEQLNLPFEDNVFEPIKGPEPENYKKMKEEYDDEERKLPLLNTFDIYEWADQHKDNPFFNFDNVAKIIALKDLGPPGKSSNLELKTVLKWNPQNTKLANRFNKYLIEYYIDNFEDMSIYEYLEIETKDIDEEHLRKAQNKIIKHIIELTNEKHHFNTGRSQKNLKMLLEHSRKFDKSFLKRLAKHLGIEYYGELMADLNNKLVKDKYDIYDIAELIAHSIKGGAGFSSDTFKRILGKADNKAKEYLRTFLYTNTEGTYEKYKFNNWILDENFKPMTSDYKNIALPAQFYIMRYWQDVKPLADVWMPIFDDFKIIPNMPSD